MSVSRSSTEQVDRSLLPRELIYLILECCYIDHELDENLKMLVSFAAQNELFKNSLWLNRLMNKLFILSLKVQNILNHRYISNLSDLRNDLDVLSGQLNHIKKILSLRCSYCDKTALENSRLDCVIFQMCAVCENAFYCDKECQTIHWSIHKKVCKLRF